MTLDGQKETKNMKEMEEKAEFSLAKKVANGCICKCKSCERERSMC